jgi:hypothetical protein
MLVCLLHLDEQGVNGAHYKSGGNHEHEEEVRGYVVRAYRNMFASNSLLQSTKQYVCLFCVNSHQGEIFRSSLKLGPGTNNCFL